MAEFYLGITETRPTGSVDVSDAGLFFAYDMETLTGVQMRDFSGRGNHGGINGTVDRPGKFGRGRLFDDTLPDSILVPHDASQNDPATAGAFTLAFWVRRPAGTFGRANFGKWGSYEIRVTDTVLQGVINTTFTEKSITFTWTRTDEVWYPIGFTYDEAVMRLYIDGAEVRNVLETENLLSSTNDLRLGVNQGGGPADSLSDEYLAASRVYSPSEMLSLAVDGRKVHRARRGTLTASVRKGRGR